MDPDYPRGGLVPGSSEWLARDQREHPGNYNQTTGYAGSGFLGIQGNAAMQQFGFGMLGGRPDAWNVFDEGSKATKKGGREKLSEVGTADAKGAWSKMVDLITIDGVTFRPTAQTGRGATGGFGAFGIPTDLGGFVDNEGTAAAFAKSKAAREAEDIKTILADLDKYSTELTLAKDQSFLTGILGPIEEFRAYGEAFDLLSGSMQAGFDVWVSGSGSASDAMKAFAKSALTTVASQMFSQALLHGAHAIGQFAFGIASGPAGAKNMAAAAVHAKAALAFGAGSALLGGVMRGVNAGDTAKADAAKAAGRAPTVRGGRSGESDGGNRSITVVVGETFGDDSPRQRSARVASAIRRARRELDDNKGVSSS